MSKKHGQRKARKKRAARKARARSLAAAAGALDRLGMRPGYGGALFSPSGVLLPPVSRGDKWLGRPYPRRPDPLPRRP
jgi:hypothetical protein